MVQRNFSKIIIFFILSTCLFLTYKYRWNGDNKKNWETIIDATDERGYYEYLPAFFIRHDLDLPDVNHNYVYAHNSSALIKYPVGVAIAWLPFFLTADFLSGVMNYEQTGYSELYMKFVSIAALFYLGLALLAMRGILTHFKISDFVISMVLLLLVFGTNLGYYAVVKQGMSHVYSFSMITCFVFCALSYFKTIKHIYLTATAVLLGIIILIRPTNGIIVFLLPFAAGSFSELKKAFLNKIVFSVSFCILLLIVSIQSFVWHYQCGSWLVWSYKGEGFYFLHPEIINVLLSFRKGLFVYTPLTLVSLTGLIPLYKINRARFYSFLVTLLAALYIISAWWCWSYQDSFGLRPFIDYYSIFGILLAFMLNNLSSRITKIFMYGLCILCAELNLLQAYQYYTGILHPFCMTKEKYRYVFGKTNCRYINSLGGNIDLLPYTKKTPLKIRTYDNDFENRQTDVDTAYIKDMSFCGQPNSHCYYYSAQREFGVSCGMKPDFSMVEKKSPIETDRNLFLKIFLKRYETSLNSSSQAILAINISARDSSEYYNAVPLNDTPSESAKKWRLYEYSFEVPKPKSINGEIHVYIWNKGKQEFYIDDFKVELYKVFP